MMKRKLIEGALISLALLMIPLSVGAHQGGGSRKVRLDRAPAGPYLLRVVTSPFPPTVGRYSVEIRASEAVSGILLTGLDVRLRAQLTSDPTVVIEAQATHHHAVFSTDYAAELEIPSPGIWEIIVQVSGEPGSAEISYLDRFARPTSISGILAVAAPVLAVGSLIVVYLWLLHSTRTKIRSSNGS